ncbi:hypothetical protein [Eisenbergiella tayi]|uniref:hypothetical protein n=1 Tax=Eisenbergiella tayi TaxID=1432052 RepID=UPI00307B9EB1
MKKQKSIVTEYPDICCLCNRIAEAEHHLLFGSFRPLADKDGIIVGICNEHHTGPGRVQDRIHDNPAAESLSKIAGQLAWEKHAVAGGMTEPESREAFRKRYGKSFL